MANGRMYVPSRNHLHAVDITTGESVWTTEVTTSSSVATDNDRLFITTAVGGLVAYKTVDGYLTDEFDGTNFALIMLFSKTLVSY